MQVVLERGQCRDDHRLLEGERRPRESQDRQRDVVVLPTLSHLASLATGACQDRARLVALKFSNLALRFALELWCSPPLGTGDSTGSVVQRATCAYL